MSDSVLSHDELLGSGPFKTFRLVLASGESVVRGQVMGYNTSTGKLSSYDSGGSNGLNEFYGIALEDVDATGGDEYLSVYVGGEFKVGGLVFDASGDSATQAFINDARKKGCFLYTALAN